jgi:peroxiredoxin/mono/diheme cytochrome c family protein
LLLLAPLASPANTPAPKSKIESFQIKDLEGKSWSLADQKGYKALVVAFVSCECPMSNAYLPVLNQLQEKFAAQDVRFVGINSNPEESIAQIQSHLKEFGIRFPLLKDDAHVAVKALGAEVNPQVFVLDSQNRLRYKGRIDDGYVGRLQPAGKITREDLKIALVEVLAGKEVSQPVTKAFGCAISVKAKATSSSTATVTYHRDVLPILQNRCQSCHRPGDVGPFPLQTYQQALRWGEEIKNFTQTRQMPPWKAEQHGVFANERPITDKEIATLAAWVDQGMCEGNPKEAPPAKQFPAGWHGGTPDLILEMPTEMTIAASGRDLFRCFVFPTNLPEDVFIRAVEVQPGNRRVVHHTLQTIDMRGASKKLLADFQKQQKPTDADFGPGYTTRMGFGFLPDPMGGLGGWAPGMLPRPLPDGVGIRLPKGSNIVLQIHYHRTGKVEKDKTRIGLYFAKKPVTQHFQSIPAMGAFRMIPAGAENFKVDTTIKLTQDVTLHWLVPHMHLLGKDIELTMTLPGGKEQTLISIRNWDYNWQEMYQLKEPMQVPAGTLFRVKATFDNSANNPLNPSDPPKRVRFGEQTTDEMCFVFMGVSSPNVRRLPFTFVGGLGGGAGR